MMLNCSLSYFSHERSDHSSRPKPGCSCQHVIFFDLQRYLMRGLRCDSIDPGRIVIHTTLLLYSSRTYKILNAG